MMHLKILLFIVILFCTGLPSLATNFEIKHADNLEAGKTQISIKGNVVITYKDALIEAPTGEVLTNDNGEPKLAIFSHSAMITLKDRKIQADKITVYINDKKIIAQGNVQSSLLDKDNNPIFVSSEYQEILWSGENTLARENVLSKYQDTKVVSDECSIVYKNKKPKLAVFSGTSHPAILEQATSKTYASKFIFDINTQNIKASGNVQSTIWPDQKKKIDEQNPVILNTDELLINKDSGVIFAKSATKKVNVSYEETKGDSNVVYLIRNKNTGKPENIIFKGNASVSQPDKQLTSEEVVFDFKDKKLTSGTASNIRPKTLIFKK